MVWKRVEDVNQEAVACRFDFEEAHRAGTEAVLAFKADGQVRTETIYDQLLVVP